MTLHEEFIQLGKEHRSLQKRFDILLPQIYKSEIYKKYSKDIFEYALKFASLAPGTVKKILWTHKKIENFPALQKAVEVVGVSKISAIASIATEENQEFLAESVGHMNKPSLEQLNRDYKKQHKIHFEETMKIELDEEMIFLFNKLKKKLGGASNKETLRKILKSFPGEPATIKRNSKLTRLTRAVPTQEKRETINQTNGKCIYPHCTKPYDVIHHRERYTHSKSHESIVPLCKEHHELAHNGLIENELQNPETWKIRLQRHLNQADQLFLKYKRLAGAKNKPVWRLT